jgi:Flp pilus assembly protein TadG
MRRLIIRQAPGQSIVFVALMLLVLLAVAGLAVDVGNAYGRQRRIQSAVDGAALSGMTAVKYPKTNSAVRDDIVKALVGHGVDVSDTASYTWSASYVYSDNSTAVIPNNSVAARYDIVRVEVTATELVTTYFARVVGFFTLPAKAVGQACGYGTSSNLYPLGLPRDLLINVHPEYYWHDATRTQLDSNPFSNWVNIVKRWGFSSTIGTATTPGTGAIFQIFLSSGSQNAVWLSFNAAGSSSTSDYETELSPPGTYIIGPCGNGATPGCYQESDPPSPLPAGSLASGAYQTDGQVTIGDWMRGKTGVSFTSGIQADLNQQIDSGAVMILPLLGPTSGTGSNQVFQVMDLRQFRLLAACYSTNSFHSAVSGLQCDNTVNSYFVFEYLGSPAATAVECLPGTTPPRQ